MLPAKIARWVVENDPSWERNVVSPDGVSNPGVQTWTKKGTSIQAVASPTSMFCELIGGQDNLNAPLPTALFDPLNAAVTGSRTAGLNIASDITKYLSSSYLNPPFSSAKRFGGRDSKEFLRRSRF